MGWEMGMEVGLDATTGESINMSISNNITYSILIFNIYFIFPIQFKRELLILASMIVLFHGIYEFK